jgi:hypothetical protein
MVDNLFLAVGHSILLELVLKLDFLLTVECADDMESMYDSDLLLQYEHILHQCLGLPCKAALLSLITHNAAACQSVCGKGANLILGAQLPRLGADQDKDLFIPSLGSEHENAGLLL